MEGENALSWEKKNHSQTHAVSKKNSEITLVDDVSTT